jgi:endonuclease/exonuclease/phosphatase family metal-dependent hydrolase
MKTATSRALLVLLLALVSSMGALEAQAGAARDPASGQVAVMTRNLDPGFSEVGVLSAPDLDSLLVAVSDAWNDIVANDFPARAASIASEIVATKPDLIGIQEAPVFHVFNPDGSVETLDYLEILLSILRRQGAPYRLVAVQHDIDVTLPSATGDYIQYTDRDALLVRPGVPVVRTMSANYDARFDVPVAGGLDSLTILRGWVAADVQTPKGTFRFVSTHMEDLDIDVQLAEAGELLAGPASAPRTILVGDINSDAAAAGATYENLLAAGFTDAWSETNAGTGYTWGFDLADPSSTPTQRLDVVLHRNPFEALSASIVGNKLSDRTPSGLWPSDHAGVVATLRLDFP